MEHLTLCGSYTAWGCEQTAPVLALRQLFPAIRKAAAWGGVRELVRPISNQPSWEAPESLQAYYTGSRLPRNPANDSYSQLIQPFEKQPPREVSVSLRGHLTGSRPVRLQ
jgi:hypothetical protein